MLCIEKLKPLFIGKLKNRAFKNLNGDTFFKYYYNNSACMTSFILNQWLMIYKQNVGVIKDDFCYY